MTEGDEEYRARVRRRLEALLPIFARASVGDFSDNVELPDQDDEFIELYTGVQVMLEVIRDHLTELRELNQALEGRIRLRTQALEEAERLAHLGRWRWDLSTNQVSWSEEFGRILGREPAERGAPYDEYLWILPALERNRVDDALRESIREGIPFNFDHRISGAAGEMRWLHFQGTVVEGDDGNPARVVGIGQDITERIRFEEALRDSGEQYRSLIQNARDVIFTVALDGRITSLNPAFEQTTGWKAEEWIGKPFAEILHPDDVAGARQNFKLVLSGHSLPAHEWRIRSQSGHFLDGEMVTAAQVIRGKVTGLLGVARDVTERKRAEEKFRGLLESAPDAMVIVEASGTINLVNSQTERIFGYPRSELLGRPVEILLPEVLRRRHSTHREKYVGDPHSRAMGEGLELRGRRKDGAEFPVEISLSPLSTAGGLLIMAAVRDITERRRVEREIRLLAHTITSMNECVAITDTACEIVFVNPAFERTYGYQESEVIGRNVTSLVFAAGAPASGSAPEPERTPRSGKARSVPAETIVKETLAGGWHGEVEHVSRSGNTFPVNLSTSVLADEEGRPVSLVWMSRDITEQVNLRRLLEEIARKREQDLSVFASSIQNAQETERRKIARELHDDFGQRLTGLKFGIEVFRETLPKQGRRVLRTVDGFNRQLTSIVNDMRRLSANLHPAALDDFGLMVAIQHFCREFGKVHKIDVDFRATDGKMTRYDQQVEVALYRIVQEAFSNITKYAQATAVTVRLQHDGNKLILSIADNGKGFDREEVGGRRTPNRGLGLISMEERAEHAGGTFTIESAPSKGTTIRVEVPVK